MRLSGICLETHNVSGLVEFYTGVLGVAAQGDDIHSVLEDANLAIYNPWGVSPVVDATLHTPSGNSFTLMFEVDDVDLEYERLKQLNVHFTALPATYPWGCRAMSFVDPDGNKIDFYASIVQPSSERGESR